ncbi:hypothetical protein PR202_gb19345 [Eleusine coracana subsp. coracana]|uniref:Uncharacterized protein n=1 Tax=Eleusine coracana subsp. coracana TaxID=191504 RepID=A0AAV5F805_ELECO|nr:hypothetical protein PR202_gb19345 [Eleusine coracana subsp. coracana]
MAGAPVTTSTETQALFGSIGSTGSRPGSITFALACSAWSSLMTRKAREQQRCGNRKARNLRQLAARLRQGLVRKMCWLMLKQKQKKMCCNSRALDHFECEREVVLLSCSEKTGVDPSACCGREEGISTTSWAALHLGFCHRPDSYLASLTTASSSHCPAADEFLVHELSPLLAYLAHSCACS